MTSQGSPTPTTFANACWIVDANGITWATTTSQASVAATGAAEEGGPGEADPSTTFPVGQGQPRRGATGTA